MNHRGFMKGVFKCVGKSLIKRDKDYGILQIIKYLVHSHRILELKLIETNLPHLID